ncbi:MAG: 3-phosphoshikimate 1-carboxyvinyltransferase, partial [Sphingobacteriales bacterium]
MQIKITPSKINGTITAPASKSAMQRACALALLNDGKTIIKNPGTSNDDKAALSIIKELGAVINIAEDESLHITGSQFIKEKASAERTINCGESGLSIRMFTPIAALASQQINITGSGSLVNRPMNFFDEVFPQLSVSVQSNEGKLPLQIKGPLQPAAITIDGSLSSQFLTGLLFAFAKAASTEVIIKVENLKSKPYIDLSLQMLQHFGYKVSNNNYQAFHVKPINQSTGQLVNYTVEGDWSGASFLLVAGAIAGNISVKGLDVFSAQADKAILQALTASGAIMSISEQSVDVKSPLALKPFHFNATDCPDLFPPLVALAAYCDGTSVIEGVSRLAHKESDRALTLQEEFGKLGLKIKLQDDLMIIEGGGKLKATSVHSRHDHRIAMALAVAALNADGLM